MELGVYLRIPDGKNGELFKILFDEMTRPRFLGKVSSDTTYQNAKETLGASFDDWTELGDQKFQLFGERMNQIYDSIKSSKSRKDPEKQRLKMLIRQKGWGQAIKRAQRYLGLRQKLSLVPYSGMTPRCPLCLFVTN